MPLLIADTNGFTYAGSDTLTIAPNVTVWENGGAAVLSGFAGSMLINFGSVASDDNDGVSFTGANSTILNQAGASIAGDRGVALRAASVGALNFGTIKGNDAAVLFGTASNGASLDNRASIFGVRAGVHDLTNFTGNTIANAGTIDGLQFGVDIFTNALATTTIVNAGTIRGGTAAIFKAGGHDGAIYVQNGGTLIGGIDMNGPGRADVVANSGQIVGTVALGAGSDTFNGTGGGAVKVLGEAGADALTGGSKADRLTGGLDKDALTGGLGADVFDFDLVADSAVGALRDRILDFKHSQHDRIDLSTIDANGGLAGDPLFVFRGTLAFNAPGQVRYAQQNLAGTANDKTLIYGSTDADNAPEFQIELKGLIVLAAGDFIL